jgi:sugar phosphate isomerase/epimerase
MGNTMKGPGIFLAQFVGDEAPFNSLPSIAKWAAGHGYEGIQIPTWDGRLFELEKAATSKAYCDEIKGICADAGVQITELSTHLQGQLIAVNPASMGLHPKKFMEIQKRAKNGQSSSFYGRQKHVKTLD